MTLPHESNRAVAATREFLVRLSSPYVENGIKGVRREIRADALALLRHYPLSWNGDCPNQDNAANEDNAEVRRLRGVIAAGESEAIAKCDCPDLDNAAAQDILTDEEREAIAFFADIHCDDEPPHEYAATLRGLLKRTV
jgi:hypothetical protein